MMLVGTSSVNVRILMRMMAALSQSCGEVVTFTAHSFIFLALD